MNDPAQTTCGTPTPPAAADTAADTGAGCAAGPGDGSRDGFAQVGAVADAICYEGYLLYPYRRSSPKNRVRWQFGVLAPPAWAEAHGSGRPGVSGAAESWYQQTHCLCDAAPDAVLRVRVRYLQAQYKSVQRRTGADGAWEPVEALDTDGNCTSPSRRPSRARPTSKCPSPTCWPVSARFPWEPPAARTRPRSPPAAVRRPAPNAAAFRYGPAPPCGPNGPAAGPDRCG